MGWYFLILAISFIHFPISLFCTEVLHLNEITGAIIGGAAGIVAAIITGIITVWCQNRKLKEVIRHLGFGEDEASMKRQLDDKLGSSGKSIADQLGVGSNDKSITAQIGIISKSVTEQLGVGIDDKSITAQHREMYDTIIHQTDKISSIYGILHDNQVRQDAENTSQANLAATMAAFQQNYVSVLNENSELKSENLSLKTENTALHEQISSLQARLEQSGEDSNDEDMGL